MEQLPTTPASVLNLLANTQTQIDVFSDGLIESVKSGEENPLKILVSLKAMDKVSERVQKEIKDNCLTEAGKYPGSNFEYMGNKIEKAEVGTRYDYAQCNDPKWLGLQNKITELQSQLKQREEWLKTMGSPETILDQDSGEVITIYPPIKKSTTGLKVTIK